MRLGESVMGASGKDYVFAESGHCAAAGAVVARRHPRREQRMADAVRAVADFPGRGLFLLRLFLLVQRHKREKGGRGDRS